MISITTGSVPRSPSRPGERNFPDAPKPCMPRITVAALSPAPRPRSMISRWSGRPASKSPVRTKMDSCSSLAQAARSGTPPPAPAVTAHSAVRQAPCTPARHDPPPGRPALAPSPVTMPTEDEDVKPVLLGVVSHDPAQACLIGLDDLNARPHHVAGALAVRNLAERAPRLACAARSRLACAGSRGLRCCGPCACRHTAERHPRRHAVAHGGNRPPDKPSPDPASQP